MSLRSIRGLRAALFALADKHPDEFQELLDELRLARTLGSPQDYPACEEVALAYEKGETLRSIATRRGMTAEGVRQRILRVRPPEWIAETRIRVQAAQVAKQQQEREWFFEKRDWHCAVCGGLIRRIGQGHARKRCGVEHRTCSATCAEAWPYLRYALCLNCRKLHLESCLRTPSAKARGLKKSTTGGYQYAIRRGSKTHQALEALRPDLLDGADRVPFADEIPRVQWWSASRTGKKKLQKVGR